MSENYCDHPNCWFYPLTKEWYLQTKEEIECMDPDYQLMGISYCPWCGRKLDKDGKASS